MHLRESCDDSGQSLENDHTLGHLMDLEGIENDHTPGHLMDREGIGNGRTPGHLMDREAVVEAGVKA